VKVIRYKKGLSVDIFGISELICDKFTRKTCLVLARTSLKVKVNFSGMCAVYVWKKTSLF